MRSSLAGVVSIATLIAACGGFGSEDEEQQSQQPPPPSTSDENAKPPPDVPGKPIEGIYVSARQGKAGATGFPGAPVPTIAEGMKIARDKKLRLIVCAEEYAENFEVLNGVSAYGYYDCSAPLWKRTNDHAKVRAPKTPAMTASDIELPTRIEGFDVFAPDLDGAVAIDREGTSVGLLARNTKPGALIIGECTLHGGKASPGRDGDVALAPPLPGTAAGNPGAPQGPGSCNPALDVTNCQQVLVKGPAGTGAVSCGAEPAPGPGGKGGDGMWFNDRVPGPFPTTEHRGLPLVATAAQAQGGPAASENGLAGAEGVSGSDGVNGAWRFDADGFLLGDGTRGGSGAPGQGGGGGGGASGWCFPTGCGGSPPAGVNGYQRSPTGGSGGGGGCGGLAGNPGGGGGASVGVLAFDAAIAFERSLLEPSSGGRAGLGRLGGFGRTGGAGGAPGQTFVGRGGDGGAGGVGGSSGHGASGPAIALAWLRVKPTRDGSTELRQGIGGEGRGPLSQIVGEAKTIAAMPTGATIGEYEIKLE